ncbi:MAG: hypothetical protein JXA14_01360, partial [Anaerolineae bacterium]|nr:hypothetical protein [Anaerolineae bacterium]
IDKPSPVFFSPRDEGNRLASVCAVSLVHGRPSWESAAQRGLGVYPVRVGGRCLAGDGRLPGACGRALPGGGWAPTWCAGEGAAWRGMGAYLVRGGTFTRPEPR